MTDLLTLNEILDLPKIVLQTCNVYEEYSELLSELVIEQYYYPNIRKDLNLLFEKFKEIKYSYPFPFSYCSSVNFSNSKVDNGNRNYDKVGDIVMKSIDSYTWMEQFYQSIIALSSKLTNQEAVYFVDSFFGHRSESFISEKLGISRMTLQKIKKSCFIKMYLEFLHFELPKT